MSPLFAVGVLRIFKGPIDIGESTYDYFNRSARLEAERGREIMNLWYDEYPADRRRPLLRRLRSRRRDTFEGALFELYLHALLRACGFRVLVQPVSEEGLTPDFQVENDGGVSFRVEATITREPECVEGLDAQIYELNKRASLRVAVPGFGVHLRSATRGRANLRPRDFAAFLDRWFDEAKSRGALQPRARAAERIYSDEESGWRLELGLRPLTDPNKKPAQVVCSQMGSGGVRCGCEAEQRFRVAIRRKVRRYRGAGPPLVVAVASNDFQMQPAEEEITNALLGDVRVDKLRPGARESLPRNSKGVWCRDQPESHRCPVGVIHVAGCYPSGLATPEVVLWDNPCVEAPTLFRPWPLKLAGWPDHGDQPTIWPGEIAASVLGI